jgi:hypothetical protein
VGATLEKVVAARSLRQGRRLVPGTEPALAIVVHAPLISVVQTMAGLGRSGMAACPEPDCGEKKMTGRTDRAKYKASPIMGGLI